MKRYDAYDDGTLNECHDGDWVKHEDAQAAIQEAVLAERTRLARLCVEADDFGVRPSHLANLILGGKK